MPLHAIYDDDLEKLLENIGLLATLKAGKLHCHVCSDPITLESFYAAYPNSGAVRVVCSKPRCIKEFTMAVAASGD